MSQENVEKLRDGNAAIRRGDWDAVAAIMDPHIVLRMETRWPEQRAHGREAALAFYRDLWQSAGTDVRIEEITDLGDRALVRFHWHMRGARSGIEGEEWVSVVCTFRDGRVVLEEFFPNHEEALKAVGLEE